MRPALRVVATALIGVAASAAAALAEPVLGEWATEPDRKGQTGIVAIRQCGAALCGRIVRAYDSAGNPVVTPNVGKELFWNMRAAGGGAYRGGRVWVPARNREYDARMDLVGDRLEVKGCLGPVCDGQVWRRVR